MRELLTATNLKTGVWIYCSRFVSPSRHENYCGTVGEI